MKRIAVTRAQPEADRTAARLRALGAEPVLAPLLTIEARPCNMELADAQALLFTSANGVRAFAARVPRRDIAALTVGDATAEAARNAGYADVLSADGDAHALIQLATETLSPQAGRVIHVSGAHVAGDVAGALRSAGFDAERRIAYEAVAAAALPDALRAPLDSILFHSARAAEIFAGFGAPGADRLIAVCLSNKVAEAAMVSPAGRITWKQVLVAARPREDALLEAALTSTGASA